MGLIFLLALITACTQTQEETQPKQNMVADNSQTQNNAELEKTDEAKQQPADMMKDVPKIEGVTQEELASHNSEDDCWISYDGAVYDITDFLPIHPGTAAAIAPYCGTSEDFAQAFNAQHGTSKVKKLEKEGEYKGTYN